MALLRHLLPVGPLVALTALASGLVGFVYAHEPARDQVALSVDRERPAGETMLLSGTVSSVADGRLVLSGEGGSTDLVIPMGAPVEDLQALPAGSLATGARVNVGAERSDFGVALTGVVVVAER